MKITEAGIVIKVKTTLIEPQLGSQSANKDIHAEYIASKAPDAPSKEEEIAAIGVDAEMEKSMTIFPKDEDGNPFMWDYQVKGFCKDACGMLRNIKGSESSKLKAYKKKIDGLIFPEPRRIYIHDIDGIETNTRSLRADTPQGPRVALATSEQVKAGATMEFTIRISDESMLDTVIEWLDYGEMRGFGQWRNAGWGRFTYEYEVVK